MKATLSYRAEQATKDLNIKIGLNQTWNLKVKRGVLIMNGQINWADYQISPDRKILAQLLLLNLWHPECLDGDYILCENKYRSFSTLIRILVIAQSLFPDARFCDLEKNDWIEIAFRTLYKSWRRTNRKIPILNDLAEPLGSQMLERSAGIIKEWYILYHNGALSDGPEYIISKTDPENLIKPELNKLGRTLHDWKEGGSYGTIPFSIAHLMLSDALSIVNSHQTKQLVAYFSFIKNHDVLHLVAPFWKNEGFTLIDRYRSTGDISKIALNRLYRGGNDNAECKERFVKPLHEVLIKLHISEEPFQFPWRRYKDIVKQYYELITAIYVIFLSVMGKRGPSEIQTLRASDIIPGDEATGLNTVMMPSIEKTNKGLREQQGVTNFIDSVFEILIASGYVDKKNSNCYLFISLPPTTRIFDDPRRISGTQMGFHLRNYFKDFCQRMSPNLEFEITDFHKSLLSHQFRHAFAEFALRRFDGSVEELIRQHFCHSYNHWWTKRYTGDKLDADREHHLSSNYIKELVPRILKDHNVDQDFVGGMALFIKREVGPNIKSMAASDAEEYIAKFCDNILQITAHEYGWCLLHEQYRSVAKCADNKGNPNPSGTSSSKCVGCANFCASRKAHLEIQKQIAISHIDFIESTAWKMPSLKQASISAVQNAQSLFPELKELGTVG